MRNKGRNLIPICKLGILIIPYLLKFEICSNFFRIERLMLILKVEEKQNTRGILTIVAFLVIGKNGVYTDLVRNVREAFEECELVQINCEGMNGSDY